VFSDIVKRRFVRGPARDLSHGLADLNRCDRANLEETGLSSVDLVRPQNGRAGIDNESDQVP